MSDPKGKRRLPVLSSSPASDEERPRAQWIAIGAIAAILCSLPLLGLVVLLATRILEGIHPGGGMEALRHAAPAQRLSVGLVVILGSLAALGIGSFLGGLLVGRHGGDAGKREGTLAGVGAGVVFSLVSLTGLGGAVVEWLVGALTTTILTGIAAHLGALLGLRWRRSG